MNNKEIGKYFLFRNYKNYYNKNGKLKGILLKITNPILKIILRLKRFDQIILKSIRLVARKFNLNSKIIKESKIGDLYIKFYYRSNYKRQARKFISNQLGIKGFFIELKSRNVDYVILRWFEKLPELPEGEDIDILIKDEDLDKIFDLFNKKPEGIPIDTYTINGTKGCSFGIAGSYYPPVLGEKILKHKELFKDTFYIPNTEYHFLSLVYHIVYHKAEKSGLPISKEIGLKYNEVDHNYKKIINEFPQSLEIKNQINLKSLHEYLKKHDFSPNLDTLRKLAMKEKSGFLFDIAKAEEIKGIEPYDIIVFFVREWAFEKDAVLDIIDTIISNNLEIVSYYYLKDSIQERVAKQVRGGNWGRGPYPADGGLPKLAIITFDYHPKKPKFEMNNSHPFVSNTNVFIKGKVRDIINDQMLITKWVNSLHSSDDFTEAKDYIDIIDSKLYDKVKKRIDKLSNLYTTNEDVIKSLPSKNRRSKTEIINYNSEWAVKKTFKKGSEMYLEKELFAYKELSKRLPYIPQLVDSGENYFIIPYYKNILKECSEQEKMDILKKYKKDIIFFLNHIYNEGFAIIDFNPGNILITPEGELKIVDYEFLYKYTEKPDSFLESYDIKGIPNNFDGRMPNGTIPPGVTYNNTWKRLLGKLK